VSTKLRVFVRSPLQTHTELLLDDEAARHVQVLRLQPGMWLELFNGEDGCYAAQVLHMGRQQVQVQVHSFSPDAASLGCRTQLVLGMPANERMDWLIEKATELGVSRITPLMTQRTVLKLQGERALKRQLHWLGIAQSACAQSGRNRVPQIDLPQSWSAWWSQHQAGANVQQFVLSLHPQAQPWRDVSRSAPAAACVLSGPEGGLSEEEESFAIANGFAPVSLGRHTLRSETAPLVVLSQLLL
jgi:16S rRNA (uracil1498-N3)-methyltransferase